MNYGLPKEVNVENRAYAIRNGGDWRVILDVIAALNDPELTAQEKAYTSLFIFYEDGKIPKNLQSAADEMMRFIDGGELRDNSGKPLRLMDWEQDFPLIIAPINRVIGRDIRAQEYVHWWSFLSAYSEINDCTYTTVLSIRQKQAKGKKLEKWERDYAKEHPKLVKLRPHLSQCDKQYLDSFTD